MIMDKSPTIMPKRTYHCPCGETFTRKQSRDRHQQHSCKLNNVNANNVKENNNNITERNNNNNNNITERNMINSNNTNNITINPVHVLIIPLDKGTIDDLSTSEWGTILAKDINPFIQIMKYVNCKKSSHYNIYYHDHKSGCGYVYKNGRFRIDRIYNILDMFICNRSKHLREILRIWGTIILPNKIRRIAWILDELLTNTNYRKELMAELKPILCDYAPRIHRFIEQHNLLKMDISDSSSLVDGDSDMSIGSIDLDLSDASVNSYHQLIIG